MSAQPFLTYAVTQGYGPTSNAGEPAYAGYPHYHLGIDYAAPCGTPVYAPADGVVTFAGEDTTGFGTMLSIRMGNGYSLFFGHLAGIAVAVGQSVRGGALVATSNNTGNSTGCHVHYGGLDPQGRYVSPSDVPLPAAGPASGAAPTLTVFGRPVSRQTLIGAAIVAVAAAATLDSLG